MTARELLDSSFLDVRARLLDIAAMLDRIERGQGAGEARRDPRYRLLNNALQLLADEKPDRAERIQMLFSLPYDREG
jgi:hypothetical protein